MRRAGGRALVCSDAAEHRRRVETRSVDVPGLPMPGWAEVVGREYEPWERERVVVDTSGQRPEESLAALLRALG
ncbi:hypothetical protein ACWD25_57485 [Streptomyces sp. NPDC002920]